MESFLKIHSIQWPGGFIVMPDDNPQTWLYFPDLKSLYLWIAKEVANQGIGGGECAK